MCENNNRTSLPQLPKRKDKEKRKKNPTVTNKIITVKVVIVNLSAIIL